MAVCVAAGKRWLNFEVKPGKVLFIDEESGERRFSLRLAAALRGELAGDETPLEFISLAAFHLDKPEDVILLENEITESGAALVIIDALAEIMTGDENSKQDTQPVFNALRRLADRTGAAIVVIHHSNKVGGYRGSSAIKASVDLMILITSEDGSDFVNFKSEKVREGKAAKWAGKATWTPDSFYLSFIEAQEKTKALSKSQEYVLRYLTDHGASPLPVIMESADSCSENSAKFAVYSLADLGKVRRINPGTKPAVYELTEKEN
jgi:RecA-family ATPase